MYKVQDYDLTLFTTTLLTQLYVRVTILLTHGTHPTWLHSFANRGGLGSRN